MTCGLKKDADNLSRRRAVGGFDLHGGSRGADTQHAPNLILFPRPVSSLGSAANSRAEMREPFIHVREFATAFFLGCFTALAAVLFCIGFIGYRALVA